VPAARCSQLVCNNDDNDDDGDNCADDDNDENICANHITAKKQTISQLEKEKNKNYEYKLINRKSCMFCQPVLFLFTFQLTNSTAHFLNPIPLEIGRTKYNA